MGIKEELIKERGKSDTMLASPWIMGLGFITFLLGFIITFTYESTDDQTGIRLLFLVLSAIMLPYPPYQKWLKAQYQMISDFLGKLFTGLFTIAAVLIVGGLILWGGWKLLGKGIEVITPDTWDLMICKEKHWDGVQCQTNAYVLEGYKDQKSCMEKGIELANRQGFECGKNCRDGEFGTTCDVICNSGGCN